MADPRAPVVILLDSCSYFRLGLSFHPILVRLLGDPEYVLMVIEELDREYARSSRLRTKFWWANSEEHRNERKSNRMTATHFRPVERFDVAIVEVLCLVV